MTRLFDLTASVEASGSEEHSLSAADIRAFVADAASRHTKTDMSDTIGLFKVATILRDSPMFERTDGDSWPPPPNGGMWRRVRKVGNDLEHVIRKVLATAMAPMSTPDVVAAVQAENQVRCLGLFDHIRSDNHIAVISSKLRTMHDVVKVGYGLCPGSSHNVSCWLLDDAAEKWFAEISATKQAELDASARVTFNETDDVVEILVDGKVHTSISKALGVSSIPADALDSIRDSIVASLQAGS